MKIGKLISNPYTNRHAIRFPDAFFGRAQELQDIYTRIYGGQSVSLIGERRVGKSSILYALRYEREEYLLPSEFDFVLLDMLSLAGCTEEEFLEALLRQVAQVTGVSAGDPGRAALRAAADELQRRGRRLVILLDEFEVLVHNEQIPRELFSIFRAMATEFSVSFVVASQEGSIDHLAEDTKTGSAFLNIFGTVYIGPFQEDEAKDLINIPAKHAGVVFTSEEEKLLLDLAGLFPFFLQIACYHLFNLKQSEVAPEQAMLQLEKSFAAEVKPHFEYMLNRMPDSERKELRFFIQNGYTLKESAQSGLINKGILIETQKRTRVFTQKRTRIFSKIFADLMATEISSVN